MSFDTVYGISSPAELVRETRLRKGLTQRRLALRASTSQSAIARIERGEEEVTWSRLRSLMVSMGEEPVLTSEPLHGRYDPADLVLDRRSAAALRLRNGLEVNEFATSLALAGAQAKQGRGDS